MRELARQEADPPRPELAALVADPHGHGRIEEQKRLIIAAVDVDRHASPLGQDQPSRQTLSRLGH
jgi:hypothetical protein